MGLVLISHNLGVMADTVQRVHVMYGGTVVESGPTAELFARRAHPYTQGLFAARPRLGLARGTRLATIPGRVPELAALPAGCPFAERCPRAADDCRVALPREVAIGPDHAVRCLHLDGEPAFTAVGRAVDPAASPALDPAAALASAAPMAAAAGAAQAPALGTK